MPKKTPDSAQSQLAVIARSEATRRSMDDHEPSSPSVNTDIPSPYVENRGGLYRLKRKLTYAFAFRLLNKYLSKRQDLEVLEIGTGSGFFLDFAHEIFPNSRFSGVEYDERLLAETAARATHAHLIQGRRKAACWNRLSLPVKHRNCFGKPVRDSGHKRVPEPPQRMTGVTLIMFFELLPRQASQPQTSALQFLPLKPRTLPSCV